MEIGGDVMDFQIIVDAVMSQGIWCALFVWLFYTSRTEAKEREDKLTAIIDSHSERLAQITETLNTINEKIDRYHGNDVA